MSETNLNERAIRTPDRIAGEIIALREQNKKILLISAVEIGRRLAEAREIIPFGEFGKWLAEAVSYEERTAYNLIRVYEQYGSGMASLSDGSTGTSPFAGMGYSQALVLLGLPEEERAEFIAGFDLENTSVRELKQAVQDRNQARIESAALRIRLDSQHNTITTLNNQLQKAQADIEKRAKAHWKDQGSVNKLKREIKTLKEETKSGQQIAELEQQRDTAVINLKMARADAQFDLVVKGLDDLFGMIGEMAPADQETFALYILRVNRFIWAAARRLRSLETGAALAALEAVKAAAAERAAEMIKAEEAAEETETVAASAEAAEAGAETGAETTAVTSEVSTASPDTTP